MDSTNFYLLTSYLSPVIDDSTDQGWEEVTIAQLEQLLRTSLASTAADSATVPLIQKDMQDTVKLKKLIGVVTDRLLKGGKVIRPPSKSRKSTTPNKSN